MPKPISRRKLIQKLKSLGFSGPYSGGRHEFMERVNFRLVIPNPHTGDIGTKLVSIILKQLGISNKGFETM